MEMVKRSIGFLIIFLIALMTFLVSDVLADEWKTQASQKLKQWLRRLSSNAGNVVRYPAA